MGGVPYSVDKMRLISTGGTANVKTLFGENFAIFAESLLQECPIFKTFTESEIFNTTKHKIPRLDIMLRWDDLVQNENKAIIQGLLGFAFGQIAEGIALGYNSDGKLARAVKNDLAKLFEEATSDFMEMTLYSLFPVDKEGRKWITENMKLLQEKFTPKCAKKANSKESHAQLQAKIIEASMKASGVCEIDEDDEEEVPLPARKSTRKTSLATKPSPEEKEKKVTKKGAETKKPKKLAFGKKEDVEMGEEKDEMAFGTNISKLFAQASKGGASPMEMIALKAVMDYKLKVKEEEEGTASAASSSSAHTSYASGGKGKEKMSPPEPEKREKEKSPSEATTLESAATMEVALQIKERDFKIKHLEEQLHKLELETKIKNEMAEKVSTPPP